jgi:hypothetical protein
MARTRLPLLKGRITSVETYESPQRGGSSKQLPSLDPGAHRVRLLQQLDAIRQQVDARPKVARDELASREIVAVHPAPGTELSAAELSSKRADARLIGESESGTVLLDVANGQLDHFLKKIDAFADDAKVKVKSHKDGTTTTQRANASAIAPIDTIVLAELADVGSPRLRATTLANDRAYWFEIACRGGYRQPPDETDTSRAQLNRQLHRMGVGQPLDELAGPNQIYFFVRLTLPQLEALRAATDCIYEVDLAPPPIRDLALLEEVKTHEIRGFPLQPPAAHAPAVVILDTGIATGHPLLGAAILSATTAGDEIPSPEDTHGHGTKMAGVALHRDLPVDTACPTRPLRPSVLDGSSR